MDYKSSNKDITSTFSTVGTGKDRIAAQGRTFMGAQFGQALTYAEKKPAKKIAHPRGTPKGNSEHWFGY